MIVSIQKDISADKHVGKISACFHNTLCAAIGEVCSRIRASDGVNRVCLSGGTFQNLYLLGRTVVELRRRGFEVFMHALVPANDGGLSLGQAMVANERLRRGE
jgi:hydrogenase maturation protein HypF